MNRRRRQLESGQAMVEFALVAPVLLMTVFGLMLTGYTFGKQLDLKSATRDGARRGAVYYGREDAATLAEQAVLLSVTLSDPEDVEVAIDPPPPWEHGQLLTVSSSTPHEFEVLGVSFWEGELTAESEIRVE